jgi:hypothetical protein
MKGDATFGLWRFIFETVPENNSVGVEPLKGLCVI